MNDGAGDMHRLIPISSMGRVNNTRSLWLLLCVVAQVGGLPVGVTRGQVDDVGGFAQERALGMMQSAEAGVRAVAYRACRQLGDGGKPVYRKLLECAKAFHEGRIEESIGLASDEANRFSGTLLMLQEQRAFALRFTLTSVENDSAMMADLSRAHGDVQVWYREALAQHGRAAASMAVVHGSSSAIDEITRELAFCVGRPFAIAPQTFEQVLSRHSTLASNLHDRLAELVEFQRARRRYQAAMRDNGAQTTATAEMRIFTDLLNERRNTLGLPLLRLEARLSSACAQHAAEMEALRYFAHRSPVAENATPDLRARNARYPGTLVGENIYFYASPRDAQAAFDAWCLIRSQTRSACRTARRRTGR
jgi:hypothetical protein